MSNMGRPKKISDPRTHITIYLGKAVKNSLDEYLLKVKRDNPDYSRSDFVNDAITFYLDAKEKEGKRNAEK